MNTGGIRIGGTGSGIIGGINTGRDGAGIAP